MTTATYASCHAGRAMKCYPAWDTVCKRFTANDRPTTAVTMEAALLLTTSIS